MTAFISDILSRDRDYSAAEAQIDHFSFGPEQEVNPEIVVQSPDWSLYCIDIPRNLALFVELPAGMDLAKAPFVYTAQFEHAKRAVTVPLDMLGALSQQVETPPTLGMLFSTGRCGSTLASRILAEVPNVWSLSEPDCFLNLSMARYQMDEARIIELIGAAARLMCHPPKGLPVDVVVIKPRSELIVLAEEYVKALPESRNVFMYRDAEGYVNSIYRFVQRIVGEEAFFNDPEVRKIMWYFSSVNAPLSLMDEYLSADEDATYIVDVMALGWMLRTDAYLAALGHNVALQPLHYKDLNTDRRAETEKLLTGFGIPIEHTDVAMRAFERDAHEGSGSENAVPAHPLDDAQRERVHELLLRWQKANYTSDRLPARVKA